MGKEIAGIGLALAGFLGLEVIGFMLAGWPFPAISGCIVAMVWGASIATVTGNAGAERSGNATGNEREGDDGGMVVRFDPDDPEAMIPGRS
jgi:hypothetical protein